MTKGQRIRSIITAAIMVIGAIILFTVPEIGFPLITLILGISLMVMGIGKLIYFFRMAKNMVGGRLILYVGVILTDLGLMTLTLVDRAEVYIVLYLIGFHFVSGAIQILRALEARKYASGAWRINLIHGIIDIAVVAGCFICYNQPQIIVWIYASGLIYSAILRVISALRKSAVVYIQ